MDLKSNIICYVVKLITKYLSKMGETFQDLLTPQEVVKLVDELTEPLVSSEPYFLDAVVELHQQELGQVLQVSLSPFVT